jgi:hypothetical protein
MANDNHNVLTEKQVSKWREALGMIIGPYAYLLPVEDINRIRDGMADKIAEEYPTYDFEVGDTIWVDGTKKGRVKEISRDQITIRWPYGGNKKVHAFRIHTKKSNS